jgi:hypothetical protein
MPTKIDGVRTGGIRGWMVAFSLGCVRPRMRDLIFGDAPTSRQSLIVRTCTIEVTGFVGCFRRSVQDGHEERRELQNPTLPVCVGSPTIGEKLRRSGWAIGDRRNITTAADAAFVPIARANPAFPGSPLYTPLLATFQTVHKTYRSR